MNYDRYTLVFNKPDEIDVNQFFSIRFEEYQDYSKIKSILEDQYIIILIFLIRRRYQCYSLLTGGGG